MILVDSSVWVDHFRSGDAFLLAQLNAQNVVIHPFVLGEISLGHMSRYEQIMEMLSDLPSLLIADDAEVRHMIRRHRLFGSGIGYVDAHLLGSVLLSKGHTFWTRDKKLHRIADSFGVAMPNHLH
jgi:predicted nucleic acid-binding protein